MRPNMLRLDWAFPGRGRFISAGRRDEDQPREKSEPPDAEFGRHAAVLVLLLRFAFFVSKAVANFSIALERLFFAMTGLLLHLNSP